MPARLSNDANDAKRVCEEGHFAGEQMEALTPSEYWSLAGDLIAAVSGLMYTECAHHDEAVMNLFQRVRDAEVHTMTGQSLSPGFAGLMSRGTILRHAQSEPRGRSAKSSRHARGSAPAAR